MGTIRGIYNNEEGELVRFNVFVKCLCNPPLEIQSIAVIFTDKYSAFGIINFLLICKTI